MEPPAIPTGLRATGGDNQVHLAWEAVADTDLAGYHVERTLTSGTPDWTRLTRPPCRPPPNTSTSAPSTTPASPTASSLLQYPVEATNRTQHHRRRHHRRYHTTSTHEPRSDARRHPRHPDLKLGPTEIHRAGYHVERATTGSGFARLTTTPVTTTSYGDVTAGNGTAYTYRVLAVDKAGNQSEPSTTADATPKAHQPESTTFSVGDAHSCQIRGGALWCWGNNQSGTLGDAGCHQPLSSPPASEAPATGPASALAALTRAALGATELRGAGAAIWTGSSESNHCSPVRPT